LAFFFVLFAMTSVGLPGLNGFVGEFLTMLGTFNSPVGVLGPAYAILAATGVVLAALYLLYLTARIVWSTPAPGMLLAARGDLDELKKTRGKLDGREFAMLAPLALGCVLLGVFPQLILGPIERPVAGYVAASTAYANDPIRIAGQAEPRRRGERGDEQLYLSGNHATAPPPGVAPLRDLRASAVQSNHAGPEN
jgi:NADH:ubiquinone oxidoreductase subunit 4 (subunit M)